MSLSPDWNSTRNAEGAQAAAEVDLAGFVPSGVFPLENPQTDIPRIARDSKLTRLIDAAIQRIPTTHMLNLGDARAMSELAPTSVQLVLTSPPYWTRKEYRDCEGQMGHIEDYDEFLVEPDKVRVHCWRGYLRRCDSGL